MENLLLEKDQHRSRVLGRKGGPRERPSPARSVDTPVSLCFGWASEGLFTAHLLIPGNLCITCFPFDVPTVLPPSPSSRNAYKHHLPSASWVSYSYGTHMPVCKATGHFLLFICLTLIGLLAQPPDLGHRGALSLFWPHLCNYFERKTRDRYR